MPLLFTFIFAYPLLFLSLSLVSSIANQALLSSLLRSLSPSSTHTHTQYPPTIYPPLLFFPSKIYPFYYIIIYNLSLSLTFPSKIGFLSGLLHYFFSSFSDFLLAHLRPQSLLVNYSSSTLSFWGHLGFCGFVLFDLYIGLSMLIESLLVKKEALPLLLLLGLDHYKGGDVSLVQELRESSRLRF
jgi:hypothetical protein